MNKKLLELASEAGFDAELMEMNDKNGKPSIPQKFAELIIEECIASIDDGSGTMSSMAESSWRSICQWEIKHHFGVK